LSAEFGDKMKVLYEKDLAAAHEITYENWKKRSIYTRMKERAARLWARFL
jgi:cardiolipin synthase